MDHPDHFLAPFRFRRNLRQDIGAVQQKGFVQTRMGIIGEKRDDGDVRLYQVLEKVGALGDFRGIPLFRKGDLHQEPGFVDVGIGYADPEIDIVASPSAGTHQGEFFPRQLFV